MMDDFAIRMFALLKAVELVGERADPERVLDVAGWIYDFLTDAEGAPGRELPN